MPHIDESEYAVMDRMEEFIQLPGTLHITLKPNEKGSFQFGDIEGGLRLIKTEVAQYALGGCGNCLGTRAFLRLTYRQKGRSVEEDLTLNPGIGIAQQGPFRFVLSDLGDGMVAVHINL